MIRLWQWWRRREQQGVCCAGERRVWRLLSQGDSMPLTTACVCVCVIHCAGCRAAQSGRQGAQEGQPGEECTSTKGAVVICV